MRIASRLSFRFACSLLVLACATAQAAPRDALEALEAKAAAVEKKNSMDGWAYVISGGLAVAISIPAYYASSDVFAKSIYSIGETLGTVAVGYGSYLVLVDNEYTRFNRMLQQMPDLSLPQKKRMADLFLKETADRERNVRKIRVITHSLTAGLNYLNAATSSNRELSTALYFVGGVNTLAALGAAFSRSEEEKLAESVASSGWSVGLLASAPGATLSLRF